MHAIAFETRIDKGGYIYIPEEYQYTFGKHAQLIALFPETPETSAPSKRSPGSAKGILAILADDDDTHLNDFKEYMP